LLIVFGDMGILDQIPGGLSQFVESGGAVLAASDRQTPGPRSGGRALKNVFGITIHAQPVLIPDDSKRCYRRYKECPIVEPLDRDVTSREGGPPLFQDLSPGVVTNLAGFLERSARGLKLLPILAVFPKGCEPPNPQEADAELPLPFAVGGPWGEGRVLILADESVFINNMMMQNDTSNVEFS
jgi:hypothetical protein